MLVQSQNSKILGSVHSIETMGALDGPGLRTVVFMQGCPLKCKYCHNIDCAVKAVGTQYTPEELYNLIIKNKSYWGTFNPNLEDEIKGGITFSGGEPTVQYEFLSKVLELLKNSNVHIAFDTCLLASQNSLDSLIPYTNLWMVSVKHMDEETHKWLTSVGKERIHNNIRYLDDQIINTKKKAKIRIRFLVIPGITDSNENVLELGKFVSKIKNLELIEILPYGSHGKHKWYEIYGKYHLESTPDATYDDLKRVATLLESFKFNLKY